MLAPFRVGIAGCGGLGSNCAIALARAGIGELVVVDFDIVDESNLNRQYYFKHQLGQNKAEALAENIRLTGSSTKVFPLTLRLSSANAREVFDNCSVVVEAFDRADQKKMLIETLLADPSDFIVVSGVGMAGWGDNSAISVQQLGNLIICGDLVTEVAENLSPIAPRVGVVANMQANEVLEILLGKMKKL